jgi:hypothetical protein
VLKVWTTFVLFCKFFANIKWNPSQVVSSVNSIVHKTGIDFPGFDKINTFFEKDNKHVSNFLSSETSGYIKLGLFSKDSIVSITFYILPEIIILCLLMVNSIYLRMLGFRNQSEDDIEDVIDGIHRTIERGDIEKVKEQQKLDCFMNLKQ